MRSNTYLNKETTGTIMACPECGSVKVLEHDVTMIPILPTYHCVCTSCGYEWQHR